MAETVVAGETIGEVLVEEHGGTTTTQARGLGAGDLLEAEQAARLQFLLGRLARRLLQQLGGGLEGQHTGGQGKNVLHGCEWGGKIVRPRVLSGMGGTANEKGGPIGPPFS